MADEAHRSQYGFKAKRWTGKQATLPMVLPSIYAMRFRMPRFIGFTGTPIEKADVNTPAVFGDYIATFMTFSAAVERWGDRSHLL